METQMHQASGDADLRFAESVRTLRAERGWSQEQLAQELRKRGVSDATQVTVSRMEAGRRIVRLSEALAISDAFGVTISALTNPRGPAAAVAMIAGLTADAMDAVHSFQSSAQSVGLAIHNARSHRDHLNELIASGHLAPDLLRSAHRSRAFLRQIAEYDASADAASIIRAEIDDLSARDSGQGADSGSPRSARKVFSFQLDGDGNEIIEVDNGVDQEAP